MPRKPRRPAANGDKAAANPNPSPATRFQPGHPGAKPVGARRILSASFIAALARDFNEHGADAIAGARMESPLGYCRLVASLLPQKIEIEKSAGTATDAELLEIARGAIGIVPAALPLPEPNVDTTGTA